MKILLTNDDGIDAEGINSLFEILSVEHETYMIAPDRERSACSNAFTISSELKMRRINSRRYSLSGFPADCVNVGLHSGIIPEADMVISGINHGPNLGDDTFFSGTVAGARSAHIFGKRGIAISMNSYHRPSEYFNEASEFLLNYIRDDISPDPEKPLFININYPDLPMEKIAGVKNTRTGKRLYKDSYACEDRGDDEMILRLQGSIESEFSEGTDISALDEGYISITPLTLDCTDYHYIKR